MTTKILTGVYTTKYMLASPVTTLRIEAGAYLAAGLTATGAGDYTVVNDGHISADKVAVHLTAAGAVFNAGTIESASTTAGEGVILAGGGSLTNEVGGLISGYFGVDVETLAGTVVNDGRINGLDIAVQLKDGGEVTNGSTSDTGAVLEARLGVVAELAATVHNYGTVVGLTGDGVGVYLGAGGLVTNGSTSDTVASIVAYALGVAVTGAAGTISNFGTVRATGTAGVAAALVDGGLFVNGSTKDQTALLQSNHYAVGGLGQAATLENYGIVSGGYASTGKAFGVYFKDGGVVTNGATTDTAARISGFEAVEIEGATGGVSNFGVIGAINSYVGVLLSDGGTVTNGGSTDTSALIEGYAAVAFETIASSLQNFGTIQGAEEFGSDIQHVGVLLAAGGSVTNGSSTDIKALISGESGVYAVSAAAATVSNFGSIEASVVGIALADGGRVTNGSSTDTSAVINGGTFGVDILSAAGAVDNMGTIIGGVVVGYGVLMQSTGALINGSTTDHTALILGSTAVEAAAGDVVTNDAVIRGDLSTGGEAVDLDAGANLTNNTGALVSGSIGVTANAGDTVTNFGTIQGTVGYAVLLNNSTARLDAESGSVIEGVISAGGGLVDIVSGVASAGGITSLGKIEGAGTLSLDGAASALGVGVSLTVTEIEVGGAATAVYVTTKLADSRLWDQSGGTLSVAAGDQMTFEGVGDTLSGTVTGAGTFYLDGGSDTLSNVTLSAAKMVISASTVTLSGQVSVAGELSATTPGLVVAAEGATLSGGGDLLLTDASSNLLTGATASATLTNKDIIKGAGQVGGGSMRLVNDGTIESAYTPPLIINTGVDTIVNAGLIEAVGAGGLTIDSALDNTGTLTTDNATLTVTDPVTGSGEVRIVGGEAIFGETFTENVAFGSSGRLVLGDSQAFAGEISDFSKTGATSLDLKDIADATATTSYSGTSASGILTVTDGTHTARIRLIGDYLTSTWTLSSDGDGGVIVVDPVKGGRKAAPTSSGPAPLAPLVGAMAAFGGGSGVAVGGQSQPRWPVLAALAAPVHDRPTMAA